jgi:hypothetical protein
VTDQLLMDIQGRLEKLRIVLTDKVRSSPSETSFVAVSQGSEISLSLEIDKEKAEKT